ncbi:MAG: PGF-pre-PGF domain-containing protein, partial [archaeon]
PPAPTPETPGGGGGSTSGPTLAPKVISYETTIPLIPKDDIGRVSIPAEVETIVREVEIDVLEEMGDVTFMTRDLLARPSSVPPAPPIVYGYCEIAMENLDATLTEDLWIKFRISDSWIERQNIDPASITLLRYTDQWDPLETEILSPTEEYALYRAKTPGFSIFAVSGAKQNSGIHLVHDENITIQRGETLTYAVIVENIGSTDLNNLKLTVPTPDFETSVVPETISLVPVGSRSTFLVKIDAPETLLPGIYTLPVRAESDEGFSESILDVFVPVTAKPSIEVHLTNAIDNLKTTAKSLWLETQWIGLRGGNVTDVFALIKTANEKLDQATDTFGMISFDLTSGLVEEARTSLEEAVTLLAKQQPLLKFFKVSRGVAVFLLLALLAIGTVSARAIRKYVRIVREYKHPEQSIKQIKQIHDEQKQLSEKLSNATQEYKKGLLTKQQHDEAQSRLLAETESKAAAERARLSKQLVVLEEGFNRGFIKEDIYLATKEKIKLALAKSKLSQG